DARVLQANNLPHVTGPRYDALFRMLKAGRFDYFPRGLYQIKNELNTYADWGFTIVPNLALHYPNAIYFFVAKDNNALAERIAKGVHIAKADGSFDALIDSFPQFTWAQQQLENPSLKRIFLHAPEMP
ncbi:MAG TPA: transporter substrate-binding domain-containing protein, partial [Cellvibrionaceae bacterium]